MLHLVPHTTCLWLSHWEANTLLRRPRESSLSLRIPGMRPAANPRRLRWKLHSCCCCGRNSLPLTEHTTDRRLCHQGWAWRAELDTRARLITDWHQSNWQMGKKEWVDHIKKSKVKQSTFINVLYHTRFNCIPLQILSTKCNRIDCLYLIIIYPSRPYEYQRLYSWETLQYKMVLK